jgi:U1 small nuclear ribonucleoprotein
MTDKLPPNLLALFQPRPTLKYLLPHDHAPGQRRTKAIDGSAAFVQALHEKQEQEKDDIGTESWLQRKDREALEKKERHAKLIDHDFKNTYKPQQDPNIRGDAYKTLFISRLSYDVTTKDLEREFSRFGAIERVRIVTDKGKGKNAGKPRGYAFVLFENELDMKGNYTRGTLMNYY